MKYMGSKARHAKHILPIILKNRKEGQWYVEPFVGGGNLIDKVTGNRIGGDSNLYVIEALKLIRDNPNSLPKDRSEFTEEMYREIKKTQNPVGLAGYAGYALSFGGKWFCGFRKPTDKRDYIKEAWNNARKQSPLLFGVELSHAVYIDLEIPPNSIIYCDPPYEGTTEYSANKEKFDHEKFWDWVRQKSQEGHEIFVSEYKAPEDFKCVWQREISSSLDLNTGGKKAIEKLFVPEGQVSK